MTNAINHTYFFAIIANLLKTFMVCVNFSVTRFLDYYRILLSTVIASATDQSVIEFSRRPFRDTFGLRFYISVSLRRVGLISRRVTLPLILVN